MMNNKEDKQCYIDAGLPDSTPHDKGIRQRIWNSKATYPNQSNNHISTRS